jgi:hypothetical protein
MHDDPVLPQSPRTASPQIAVELGLDVGRDRLVRVRIHEHRRRNRFRIGKLLLAQLLKTRQHPIALVIGLDEDIADDREPPPGGLADQRIRHLCRRVDIALPATIAGGGR